MMSLTTLPKSFWGYALETAARILNMVPTKKVDRTPYEIWHRKTPILSYLRVWGCEALVKQDTPDKHDSRSIKCIFIGYPKEMMDYYFYYPLKNKIFVSRNAELFENSFMVQEASGGHGLLEVSGSDKALEIIQEEDTQPSKNTSKEHEEVAPIEVEPQSVRVLIRRSARIPQAPDRYGYYVDVEEYELGDFGEPPNYIATLVDPESNKWLEAMNTEMQSMKDNQVWVLVELPPNGRTVGSKWIFKKKTDMHGNVHTFKACLVAKGYTQTYRVDYRETFYHVAGIRAIRILLAIATFYDYEIWQMDVKTAFLNGHLSEDVYMVQPEGFVDPKRPNNVCKLQHSIYGLKQASRTSASNVASLVLYVDDILLMGNSIVMLQEVKSWLCKCFSMKDLGEAAYILGIKIIRDRYKRLIALSQSAILEKILQEIRMELQERDMVLVYGAKPEDELKVSCYVDASFQTDKDDTKSQTGYVFVLNGGVVDWKSAKQSTTAMSSIEAEYIAAAKASMEAVWMRKFIDGLKGVMPYNKRPMEMLCDNEPALAFASYPEISLHS
ncbi:retrotransposon protein, putative, ty1-copia subclass [Tanacetum coccineum]